MLSPMSDAIDVHTEAGHDAAEAVLAFINTRSEFRGRDPERFGSADDFNSWASEHGLLDGAVVTDSDVVAARELRQALVTVLRAHSGDATLDPGDLRAAESYLDHAAARYPIKATVGADGVHLTGQDTGAAGILGTILGAAAETAQRGDWGRVKTCCSPPCQHAFFDHTRNASQRYCRAACGSRASMRAARQRQVETGDATA